MEHVAIVEFGPGSVGKTTTIKLVYAKLCRIFPDAEIFDLHAKPRKSPDAYKDIILVLTIHGTKIGLLSQADPQKIGVVRQTLRLFVDIGCDIIVCAARGRGKTLDEVRRLTESGYDVIERCRERNVAEAHRNSNEAEASWIVTRIKKMLAAVAMT